MNGLHRRSVVVALIVAGLLPGLAVAQNRRLSKPHVENLIKQVEVESDALRRQIDRTLDKSALDGTRREDRINDQMEDLENALDRLRSEFDRTDTWWETRSHVEVAMREAREMHQLVRSNRALRPIQNNWNVLRRNLNTLARAYGVRTI
jgi:hypothetical protein